MLKEFKEFATKGNLLDIGIAFVMGGAFGKIVSSLTDGIISPLIGLIGGVDLSKNALKLKNAIVDANGKVLSEAVYLKWGDFITNVINFIIVAFIMFMLIKTINSLKKKKEEASATPVGPSSTDKLLIEIRDLLKK